VSDNASIELGGRLTERRFWTLVLGWSVLIIGLAHLGYDQVAAAGIGAGPLALYYIYDEKVKQPRISLPDGRQITFKKRILTPEGGIPEGAPEDRGNSRKDYVYPVIDVCLNIQNTGNVTAKQCYASVEIDGAHQCYARWGTRIQDQYVDAHPGHVNHITLLRILPAESEGQNLFLDSSLLSDEDSEREFILYRDLPELTDLRDSYLGQSTKIGDLDCQIQCPVRREVDEMGLISRNRDVKTRAAFFGNDIRPKSRYNLEIRFGAEHWDGPSCEIDIDVQNATEGIWIDTQETYEDLRRVLAERRWKNVT